MANMTFEVRTVSQLVRSYACPKCGAPEGDYCRRANGGRRSSSHVDRWQLYREERARSHGVTARITSRMCEESYLTSDTDPTVHLAMAESRYFRWSDEIDPQYSIGVWLCLFRWAVRLTGDEEFGS